MLTGTPVTTPLTVFEMDRLPVPVNGLDALRPVEGGAAYDRIPPWAVYPNFRLSCHPAAERTNITGRIRKENAP
jgi:hypothetical protein